MKLLILEMIEIFHNSDEIKQWFLKLVLLKSLGSMKQDQGFLKAKNIRNQCISYINISH